MIGRNSRRDFFRLCDWFRRGIFAGNFLLRRNQPNIIRVSDCFGRRRLCRFRARRCQARRMFWFGCQRLLHHPAEFIRQRLAVIFFERRGRRFVASGGRGGKAINGLHWRGCWSRARSTHPSAGSPKSRRGRRARRLAGSSHPESAQKHPASSNTAAWSLRHRSSR